LLSQEIFVKKPLRAVHLVLALFAVVLISDTSLKLQAQAAAETTVPRLVRFSGIAHDLNGNPMTGVVGITFLLYAEQTGGAPLWLETQNAQADATGHYTVLLGATKPDGLPAELFTSEVARWVGVQISGQNEQARVLLVSAPYALKAGDSETVGGLPASAFMLANSATASAKSAGSTGIPNAAGNAKSSPPANPDVTGVGTIGYVPMWNTTNDIIDSVLFQKSTAIGIGTTTPAATLDLNGKGAVRDTLTLFPKSTDNTLAVSGTAFKVSSAGLVTFVSGQTYPGAGTITGITTAAGSGLSGGGTTGTLSLKVPAAGITNAMLADSKITLNASAAGGLTVPGAMTLGDTYTIGLKTCAANQVLQYSGTVWNCSAAGTGTITGISTAAGSGLAGGGTSGTLNMSIPAAGVTDAMLANSKITLNASAAGGLTVPGAMTLGDTYTIGLTTSCATNQVLKWSGAAWGCSTPDSGTVTSVATGLGLTGGPITASGTLSIDTTVVPQLGAANNFNGSNSFNTNTLMSANNALDNPALTVYNTDTGDGIDAIVSQGTGIYVSTDDLDGLFVVAGYDGADINGQETGVFASTYTDSDFTVASWGMALSYTQETIGLEGFSGSPIGIGAYGQAVKASTTGANSDSGFFPMGLWGDSGQQSGFGVFGSADDGWSFVGYNNSPSGFANTWLENEESTSASDPVLFTYGSAYGGTCTADVSGNWSCTGTISGVAPVEGGSKKVALNAIQSPENWFEDAGSGQLSSGAAVVNIESVFGETVNTGVDYHVFLTPNGDCKGLYVTQKSATSFVVRELGGGTSSIAFDYRIMAKRRGFEQIRLADKTELFSLKHRPIKPAGAAVKHMPTAEEIVKKRQQHAKPHAVAQHRTIAANQKQ
jgi:hypothetical protein